ncbi:MAG TPA: hypothetical protein DCW90_14630 [Lachnospiraceae bacterium]|nr:hypothetical protein [Lachnospiraceae bacterium]
MLNFVGLIKNNKLNSFGIFVITFMTIFLGTCFLETNQNMNAGLENLEEYNIEDFSFIPNVSEQEIIDASGDYKAALETKTESLAEKYDFVWEKREYAVLKDRKKIVRVYDEKREIDKLYFYKGNNPSEEEISIDYKYASANDCKVGDKFKLDGNEYTISGIVVFPDMISPIVDNTGKIYNDKNQCIAIVNSSYFEKMEDKTTGFVGTYRKNSKDVRDEMKQDSDFYSFVESKENPQIYATFDSQKNMNLIILGFSMGILATITILLLYITISRQIKNEYQNLGVLKALGYKKSEISFKYLFYFIIIGVPAVLGYFVGHLVVPNFYGLLCHSFSIPFAENPVSILNLAFLAIIPSFWFGILAYIISIISVRKPALSMIKNIVKEKAGRIVRRRNKKITMDNYLKGVRRTLIFSSMTLFVFILFGGFALGVQIQFAYTTYNMTTNITKNVLEEYNYEKDVRFITPHEDFSEYEKSLKYSYASAKLKPADGKDFCSVDIYALDSENLSLLKLRSSNSDKIDVAKMDGIIINDWMRLKYGLHTGDKVEIVIDGEKYETKVSAVSKNVYGKKLYISSEAAKKAFDMNTDKYNGILTNDKITFDEEEHLSILSKQDMESSINQSSNIYRILSVILFVCGLVVGVTILALSLYSVTTNYKKYIAILKINGYSEKECDYAIINGYRAVSILGYVISIPYTFVLCTIMFNIISANSDMAYPISVNPVSIIICFVITVVITEIILYLSKRQLKKITFREIMEG